MNKVTVYQTEELDFQSRVRWLDNEVQLLRSWTDPTNKTQVLDRLDNISQIVYNIKESIHQ
jgi:hypothetical protein